MLWIQLGQTEAFPYRSGNSVTLFQDLIAATARNDEAVREFHEITAHFSSGLPHPDGIQRIKNASNKVAVARKEMGMAHNRLNHYLSRGIVPEDLKRSG
jgi:hypothetical protein